MKNYRTNSALGKLLRAGLSFVFLSVILSADMPLAWAYRSSAGGGDHAEVDWGEIGMSAGISIGGAALGAIAGGAWGSAKQAADATTKIGRTAQTMGNLFTSTEHISKGFTSMLKLEKILSTVAKGYTAYMATTQASRAIGAAGAYYGWDTDDIYLFTSITNAGVTGFLNPAASMGDSGSLASSNFGSRISGMVVGGASGAASGATIIGIDGDKIRKGENPGIGAQIAGTAAGIAATEMARSIVDYRTYKVVDQKYVTKDGYVYRAGEQTPVASVSEWEKQTGISTSRGIMDRSGATLEYLPTDPSAVQTSLGQLDSMTVARVATGGDAAGVISRGGLSTTELQFEENIAPANVVPAGAETAFNAPNVEVSTTGQITMVKPTFGQALGRITVGSLKNTLDQWPTVAGTAAAMYATEDMDTNWKPLVYTVVSSVTSPILDSAATTWRLKPSLWGTMDKNLDTMLGQRPELMEQRQLMADRALKYKTSKSLEDMDVSGVVNNIGDLKQTLMEKGVKDYSPSDIEKMKDSQILLLAAKENLISVDAFIPEHLQSVLSPTEKNKVFAEFLSAQGAASTMKIPFNDKNMKETLYKSLVDVLGSHQKNSGMSSWDLYKQAGGSTFGAFGMAGENILRYDLPVATLSGLINVGFNHALKATGSDKDVMDTQLASLLGVTAASIARGTVGWGYKTYLDKKEMNSIREGKYDQQITFLVNYRDPAELISARMNAELPMPKRMYIASAVYKDKSGNVISQEKAQEMIDNARMHLSKELNAELPAIDLTKTDFDSARRQLGRYIEEYGRRQNGVAVGDNLIGLSSAEGTVNLSKDLSGAVSLTPSAPVNTELLNLAGEISGVREFNTISETGSEGARPYILAQKSVFADMDYVVRFKDPVTKETIGTKRIDNIGEDGLTRADTLYSVTQGSLADATGFLLNGVPLDQQNAELYMVSQKVPLSAAIFGNLQQGIFEMGWQTLAMGLPATKDGKLSSYGWNSYRSYLNSLAISASRQGIFKTMREQNIDIMKGTETSSSGIIENFGVSIIGNTPFVNKVITISPYVPVSGYKGMPYSELVIIETGMNRAREMFYPTWPYHSLRPYPNDPFARYLKFNLRANQINPTDVVSSNDDFDVGRVTPVK